MPSELELRIMARLTALEKRVAAVEKKLVGLTTQPVEASRRAPEKKEVAKDATK